MSVADANHSIESIDRGVVHDSRDSIGGSGRGSTTVSRKETLQGLGRRSNVLANRGYSVSLSAKISRVVRNGALRRWSAIPKRSCCASTRYARDVPSDGRSRCCR
jgi:hypothetical protein